MTISNAWQALAAGLSQHWLLERLFFSSVELALLVIVTTVAIRLLKPRTPRFVALVWTLVLAKPVVSLLLGSPEHLWELRVPVVIQSTALQAGSIEPFGPPRDRGMLAIGSALNEAATGNKVTAAAPSIASTLNPPIQRDSFSLSVWLRSSSLWFAGLWLVGVVIMFIKAVRGRWELARMLAACSQPKPETGDAYRRIAAELKVKRPPQLLVTRTIESPALVGLLRSRILLPQWVIATLDSQTIDWSLRHELMHWKHGDPWLMRVRELAECLFFFHPAAWWAGRRLEEAMEIACDCAVISSDADALAYAQRLYQILVAVRNERRRPVAAGLFATRTQIARRFIALVQAPLRTRARLSVASIVGLVLLTACVLMIGGGLRREARADGEGASAAAKETKPATEDKADNATTPVEENSQSGIVVDEQGKPLEGILVTGLVFNERFNNATKTDREGKFRLSAVYPMGGFNLFLADDGKGKVGIYQWERDQSLSKKPIRITLKPPRELQVNVLDKDGKPVEGARVGVQHEHTAMLGSGLTDVDGTWKARLPVDATIGQVLAFKSGAGFDHRSTLVNARGRDRKPLPDKVVLNLSGSRTVRVKTVDRTGQPVVGVHVLPWMLKRLGQAESANFAGCWPGVVAISDESGVAVFDWLPKLAADAITFIVGYPSEYNCPNGSTVGPATTTTDKTMLVIKLARMSGRVQFADGRPAANIEVDARGGPGMFTNGGPSKTKADGSYEMPLDSEAIYIVSVKNDRWVAPSQMGVIVREGHDVAGVDFTLSEGTLVRGRVTYGPDRRPLNTHVLLHIEGPDIPAELKRSGESIYRLQDNRQAETDKDGNWQIRSPSGTYQIMGPGELRPIPITIGDEREIVRDIHLPRAPADRVEGTVTNSEREPVPNAVVTGTPRSPDLKYWGSTAAPNGRFVFGQSSIPIVLRARSADGRQAGIARIETDDQPRVIRVNSTATARGRLLDSKGQLVAGSRLQYGIRVHEDAADPASASVTALGGIVTTAADGRFELVGLIPGEEYVLEFEAEPESSRWFPLMTTKATSAEPVPLSDIRLHAETKD